LKPLHLAAHTCFSQNYFILFLKKHIHLVYGAFSEDGGWKVKENYKSRYNVEVTTNLFHSIKDLDLAFEEQDILRK